MSKKTWTGSSIYADASRYNIAIRNGTLRDWRENGVYAYSAYNSQFEALRCYNNGLNGIMAGYGCKVNGNTCRNNTGDGIQSSQSLVTENCCVGNGTNFNLSTCTSLNNHP